MNVFELIWLPFLVYSISASVSFQLSFAFYIYLKKIFDKQVLRKPAHFIQIFGVPILPSSLGGGAYMLFLLF